MSAYLKDTGVAPAETEGEIVTADGRTLGRHAGVHHFTVGQRRGLGVATGDPLYVIATDPDFEGRGLGRRLTLAGLDWLAGRGLATGMLYVDAANTRAVRLYEDLGFTVDR